MFFIILCSDVFAQIPDSSKRNKSNLISIGIGISDFHVREEMASPLTYRNNGITGSLEYIRQGEKYKHHIELTGYYTTIKSIYEEYDAMNGRAGLRYNYLHSIVNFGKSKNFKLYAGGGLYSFYNYSQYREYTNWRIYTVASTWYLSHTIELSVLLEYMMNISNRFTLQAYFPVLANVSRPDYSAVPGSASATDFKLFGNTAPFWDNVIVQLKVGYNRKLNNWLSIFVNYDFQYSNYSEPRRVSMYMNNFRAGTNFLF